MSISYRVFVIDGEEIAPLTNRAFYRFYRGEAALPDYRGRTIDVAQLFFSTKGRKPEKPLLIDVLRLKVTRQGLIDGEHLDSHMQLAVAALEQGTVGREGNVLNATAMFNKKRLIAQHQPRISSALEAKIINAVFRD